MRLLAQVKNLTACTVNLLSTQIRETISEQVSTHSLVSRPSRRNSPPREHTLAPTPAVVALVSAPAVAVSPTAPVAVDVSDELGPGVVVSEFFVSVPVLHWNLPVDLVTKLDLDPDLDLDTMMLTPPGT